mmetsp:Transcript_20497/g.42207  ORF Transcript_20497/g.42207 Transcript_20497/m.42207 type:complete len:212 (-) Transcript_20497:892-1527(-)
MPSLSSTRSIVPLPVSTTLSTTSLISLSILVPLTNKRISRLFTPLVFRDEPETNLTTLPMTWGLSLMQFWNTSAHPVSKILNPKPSRLLSVTLTSTPSREKWVSPVSPMVPSSQDNPSLLPTPTRRREPDVSKNYLSLTTSESWMLKVHPPERLSCSAVSTKSKSEIPSSPTKTPDSTLPSLLNQLPSKNPPSECPLVSTRALLPDEKENS